MKNLIKKSREIQDQIKLNNAKEQGDERDNYRSGRHSVSTGERGDLGDLTGNTPGNNSKSPKSNHNKQKTRKINVARGGPRKTRLRSER